MKRRNTLHPAPEARKLRLKDRLIILSRRDRMGKAKPTWYRVLAVTVVLAAALLLLNGARRNRLEQRNLKPEPLISGTVRLSFTGDLDLSGNVELCGQKLGYAGYFNGVAPLWQDSAFVFSCLDGIVLPEDNAAYPAVGAAETLNPVSEQAVQAVAKAGVNALSMANNHSLDYGSRGLEHTLRELDRLGLQYAGAGENLPAAGSYRILESNGLRVGFVACSAINPNGAGPIDDYCLTTTAYSALYRNVLLAKQEADLVVVYVCWGDPDAISVSAAQRKVAHQLIESGADIVVGTHPQVLQPVERYRDGWIFYSLGNLVSDENQRGERESVLVRLDLDAEQGSGSFTLIPLLLEDFAPAPTENGFYLNQIHRSLLRELDSDLYTVTKDGRVTIPFTIS
ncbi:MAG: CapA family protein [Oscillospiraceae bacterium]|nr:CapA family protein [Oscillospiraceae bacterium]